MSDLTQVYYGFAGSIKGKIKLPFLVYEDKNDAKIFANNYTDLKKQPKVMQFELETSKLLDLTTKTGVTVFEKLIEKSNIKTEDITEVQEQLLIDEKLIELNNLDKLNYKKINKIIIENFNAIKGYSVLDNKKVMVYAVLDHEILTNKETLEIEEEGDLWTIEFKDKKM